MTAQNGGSRGEIVLYQASDGSVELDVRLDQESIWLSQKQMALLFQKDTDTIGFHLGNIYKEAELDEVATTEESSVVQQEGKRRVRRRMRFYNLDAIISVGYRVNSKRGTQFRIWATSILRDHIQKGFSVNQTRLRDLNLGVRLIAADFQRRSGCDDIDDCGESTGRKGCSGAYCDTLALPNQLRMTTGMGSDSWNMG